MPIYDICGAEKASHHEFLEKPATPQNSGPTPHQEPRVQRKKGGWLSSLVARLFFIALLILDISWGLYAFVMLVLSSIGAMLSFGRLAFFTRMQSKSLLSMKRSLVCALALITAVFSPAFGIMIACTYFLMYDKSGIEEIVPESLQEQFKEFFQPT